MHLSFFLSFLLLLRIFRYKNQADENKDKTKKKTKEQSDKMFVKSSYTLFTGRNKKFSEIEDDEQKKLEK